MVQVIAHRGARSLAPENTLAAAGLAFNLGADLWETDVNITKDNQLILFHDRDLERCTNVVSRFPGRSTYVDTYDLSDLKTLDAGSYFNETDPFEQISQGQVSPEQLTFYQNEKIPTLSQGLDLIRTLDWKVNLELKCFPHQKASSFIPDKTLELIKKNRVDLDQIEISSFNHDWLLRIHQKNPDIKIAALVGESETNPVDLDDFSFDTYNVNAKTITHDQIHQLKTMGKTVNVFTVNDPILFEQFEQMGVDGIFTDFPQRFIKKEK